MKRTLGIETYRITIEEALEGLKNIDLGKEGDFNMEVSFPIFIKDRDGWMGILNTFKEVQIELEEIDIEDKEYASWDARGLPLEFYMDKREIKIKILSETPQLQELKGVMLNYAKLGRPRVPFVYSEQQDNMVELFKAVEEHINSGRFINKLRRLFKK